MPGGGFRQIIAKGDLAVHEQLDNLVEKASFYSLSQFQPNIKHL
jgi:hypothetical protein